MINIKQVTCFRSANVFNTKVVITWKKKGRVALKVAYPCIKENWENKVTHTIALIDEIAWVTHGKSMGMPNYAAIRRERFGAVWIPERFYMAGLSLFLKGVFESLIRVVYENWGHCLVQGGWGAKGKRCSNRGHFTADRSVKYAPVRR